MKRFTSLLLVFACLLICIGCVAGCSKSNSGGSSSGSKITESRAIEIAKQNAVNACCDYSGTTSVKINYGTEQAKYDYKEDFYVVTLSGYYFPVNQYGEIGTKRRFDMKIRVMNSGEIVFLQNHIEYKG